LNLREPTTLSTWYKHEGIWERLYLLHQLHYDDVDQYSKYYWDP
jgi:hypothetical protein